MSAPKSQAGGFSDLWPSCLCLSLLGRRGPMQAGTHVVNVGADQARSAAHLDNGHGLARAGREERAGQALEEEVAVLGRHGRRAQQQLDGPVPPHFVPQRPGGPVDPVPVRIAAATGLPRASRHEPHRRGGVAVVQQAQARLRQQSGAMRAVAAFMSGNPYPMVAYGDEGHQRPAWFEGFNSAMAALY